MLPGFLHGRAGLSAPCQRPAGFLGGGQASHSTDQDLRSWWRIFGDPQLNRLVSTSLNNNPT